MSTWSRRLGIPKPALGSAMPGVWICGYADHVTYDHMSAASPLVEGRGWCRMETRVKDDKHCHGREKRTLRLGKLLQ